jgi:zinc transport system substrate-binding protein
MDRRLPLAALIAGLAGAPLAAAPAVVADIAPTQSIVARVTEGVAVPKLLLPPGASPHGYALRPSEAAALEGADVVFWTGGVLTPWLAAPLATLASGARTVALAEADGVVLLPVRAGGRFGAADHEDEDEHGHGDADDADDPEAAVDGHLWLDPMNAAAIARAAAATLAELDPENAEIYFANAAAVEAEMAALVAEVAATVDALEARGFVVFHDAYQYFEHRFGLPAAGSLAVHDADRPSPARLAAIRDRIRAADVACVFAEPQFPTGLVATAAEGSGARPATLDPLGGAIEPGPDFYPALIRGLAADLAACLSG